MDPSRLDPTPPATPPDNKARKPSWNSYRGSPFPSPPSPTSLHSSGRRQRHSLGSSSAFYTPSHSPQSAADSTQQHFQHSPTPPPYAGPNDPYAHLPRLVDPETGNVFPPRPRIYPASGVSASAPTPPSRSMSMASMASVDLSDMQYVYDTDLGSEMGVVWDAESYGTNEDEEGLSELIERSFAPLGASSSAGEGNNDKGPSVLRSDLQAQIDLTSPSAAYYPQAGSSYRTADADTTDTSSPPSTPVSLHVPYGHPSQSEESSAVLDSDLPPTLWASLPDLEPVLPPPSTISQFTPDWTHDELVKTFPTLGPVCLTSTRWLDRWEELRARRWVGGRYFPPPAARTMKAVVEAGRYISLPQGEQAPTKGRYYSFHDFDWVRTLGTGTFGRVHLAQSRHNGRLFAVKVLAKSKVVSLHQVEHTNQERALLLAASTPSTAYALHPPDQPPDPRDLDDLQGRNPFLVSLHGTWQDNFNVYMVMDYVSGGELFGLLRRAERFPLGVARFYAAEVTLALGFLHSMDIIYRDLKPENILISPNGHVKLTDFGFAKHVPDLTFTLCGTPDYLAPELIAHRPYTKSVDWYSLGVLVFEMLVGSPPFQAPNPALLYQCILQGEPRFPEHILGETEITFMKRTMTKELSDRYGHAAPGDAAPIGSGAEELMRDPFWTGIEWEALEASASGVFGVNGGVRVPWIPEEGTFNFDNYGEVNVSVYDPAQSAHSADPYAGQFPDF